MIKDVPSGTYFVLVSPTGDEVRETYYVRDPDGPCKYPSNVRAGRLATIQGKPGKPPRYCVINEDPVRNPGEIDGRAQAELVTKEHIWSHLLLGETECRKCGPEKKWLYSSSDRKCYSCGAGI